jgi:wyosine [tRNA(Phe)-imidazoG37] synthetase (radical SAM superfamily)
MPTFLFNEIIFGPVKSRRLGISLGINLLPVDRKVCNYNCLYCECGLTYGTGTWGGHLPSRSRVVQELERVLSSSRAGKKKIDTLTFAGNGEPTMHPGFPEIIGDAIRLRNTYYPESKIAVLSNATLIHKVKVREALKKVNCPTGHFSLEKLIENLGNFKENLTIQTLFVKGTYQDYAFDNSSEREINAWLGVLNELRPKLVMIYTIARDTPISTIYKVDVKILKRIARRVNQLGIPVSISS